MNEQIKQDIDLIEILFYLKKKIRVILFIIAKSELQPKNKSDNTRHTC